MSADTTPSQLSPSDLARLPNLLPEQVDTLFRRGLTGVSELLGARGYAAEAIERRMVLVDEKTGYVYPNI